MAKHFQLLVPDYDDSAVPGNAPLTYLRLGARFTSADDATLPPAERGHEWIEAQLARADQHFFKDDRRAAQGRTKPGKVYRRYDGVAAETTTTPGTWTQELLTRGGWYEHTDGNRLSTTRGDCLEVVGGNYRLVVMGRVEGAHVGRSHWESSGGHNHLSTSTPGEVTSITWTPSVEDGTWQATTETDRGNVVSYFEGKKESHFFGPSIDEATGPGVDADKSFNTVLPTLREETYAAKITSSTYADSITDTTTVAANGSIESYRDAPTIDDLTGKVLLGEIHQMKTSVHADSIEIKHAFKNRHIHSIGAISISVGMADQTSIYKGLKFALNLSVTTSVQVAASAAFDLGGGIALFIGAKDIFHFSAEVDVKLGMLLAGGLKSLGSAVWSSLVAYGEMQMAANENRAAAAFFMGPC